MNNTTVHGRIIRMRELIDKVGYAESTIYALIKEGKFPAPFKLTPGGRANGWFENTIDQYLSDQHEQTHSKYQRLRQD